MTYGELSSHDAEPLRKCAAGPSASSAGIASPSTCRWCPRRPSPCSPVRVSAPCIRWSLRLFTRLAAPTHDDAAAKAVITPTFGFRRGQDGAAQTQRRPGDRGLSDCGARAGRAAPRRRPRRLCALSCSAGSLVARAAGGRGLHVCARGNRIRDVYILYTSRARPVSQRVSCTRPAAT